MVTQRATNLELQKWIVRQHGFVVESIWLDSYRLLLGNAPQTGLPGPLTIPPDKQIAIRQAFRHFGMLA